MAVKNLQETVQKMADRIEAALGGSLNSSYKELTSSLIIQAFRWGFQEGIDAAATTVKNLNKDASIVAISEPDLLAAIKKTEMP